jgi:16S rRNA (uracil1498-N3)-methyltransferase
MRHFYIDPADAGKKTISIKGSEARHIRNVLRLKPGDRIKLFDGTGLEYEAVIEDLFSANVAVSIVKTYQGFITETVKIAVAQAFLKGKKMDRLIRPLCELGIAEWLPFYSERSVSRPDKKRLANRTERWQKIATEALKQCRRADMPPISVLTFDEVLDYARECDLKVVFWEEEAEPLSAIAAQIEGPNPGKIMIMIGPEGGFSDQEVQKAKAAGFVPAGLGPRILRAQTATLAACAISQYIFGDLGQKHLDKNLMVE